MARWSKERRLLEHENTHSRRFQLIDVEEPNLCRDIYPYNEVCRIDFDHQTATIDPAKRFLITDTTFRDGQQSRSPYTTGEMVDLYKLLHRLGGKIEL